MASSFLPVLTFVSNPDLAASADPTWNALFKGWVRCQALSHANEEFGPMGTTYRDYKAKEAEIEYRYGKQWRGIPAALAEIKPLSSAVNKEEERIAEDHYGPQTDAAIALAMHPAPNDAAVIFKVELIEREELHAYLPMPRDPWEIVAEDFARLQEAA